MKVCIVPRVSGIGGMVSFRDRLVAVFRRYGVEVTQDLNDLPYQAVLVIGGTRQLVQLWKVRRQGIPVVQRLDGMNWLHRLPPTPERPRFSLRHILRAELANLNLAVIRRHLATTIIYQSQFARQWWEQAYGVIHQSQRVIYNGVDLSQFTPNGEHQRPRDRLRILMVEGNLGGGYEWGIGVAVKLMEQLRALQRQWIDKYPQGMELMVVGQVSDRLRQKWTEVAREAIRWQGRVEPSRIPFFDRSAHLLYSADVHPACPNSVLEALACGLPVLAYATGALPELVTPECGRLVPYGGDAWRLEEPDLPALARAAVEIALRQDEMRSSARKRAESYFDVTEMARRYAEVLGVSFTSTPSTAGREEGTPASAISSPEQGVNSFWIRGLGRLSGITPLALKRLVYRLPWLAGWLRKRVNRSVGQGLQWVEITAGGLRGLSLYLDLSQEKDYWLGTYEPHLHSAIQDFVRPGQVVYDVGANVGYITLLLARCVGRTGSVVAIEPFPENVERLKKNLAANANLAPVNVIPAAVVETSRTVTFQIGLSDDTGHVVAVPSGTSEGREIEVEGVSLDDLVFERGYPAPAVVKIDIEGGEVAALQGMSRLLKNVRPLILIETHNQACTETAWHVLTEVGYRLCWMKQGYPPLDGTKSMPRRAYLVAFPPK
ncbi:MAG: hypothetical protein Kow0088_03260 [Anaerolineales bacterium]